MYTPEGECLPTDFRPKPEDRQAEGQPTGLRSYSQRKRGPSPHSSCFRLQRAAEVTLPPGRADPKEGTALTEDWLGSEGGCRRLNATQQAGLQAD